MRTLITHFDRGEFVAAILKFSTFVYVKKVFNEGKSKDMIVNVNGRSILYPVEITAYSVSIDSQYPTDIRI